MNLRKDHYRVLVVFVFGDARRKNFNVTTPHKRQCLNSVVVTCGVPEPMSRCRRRRLLRSADRSEGASKRRFKELALSLSAVAPRVRNLSSPQQRSVYEKEKSVMMMMMKPINIITLSGGSLGSCVDEERSQLREVM